MSGGRYGLKLVQRPGSPNWYIHGTAFGKEVRKSARTGERKVAETILANTYEELRHEYQFGKNTRRKWEEGVIKFLEYTNKSSLKDDLWHLDLLEPFLKGEFIDEIDDDKLKPFINFRQKQGVKARTINMSLQVVRRILNLSARKWRWLKVMPLLDFLPETDKKDPYPLSWDEQIKLFNKLPEYLHRMCLFKVNTGTRDREVCRLEWKWLVKRDDIWFFEIPKENVKNRLARIVILNDIAKSVVQQCMGNGSPYVFVNKGNPVHRMGKKAYRKARKEAGLPHVRIHDLKHTYGARLRAAGVPEEDRKFLLGHKSDMSMTTHYSAPELQQMLEYSNRVCVQDNTLVLLKRKNSLIVEETSVASTKSAQSYKKNH